MTERLRGGGDPDALEADLGDVDRALREIPRDGTRTHRTPEQRLAAGLDPYGAGEPEPADVEVTEALRQIPRRS